jgi:hypothetical protein
MVFKYLPKSSSRPFFLIIGIDDNKRNLFCTDAAVMKYNCILPISDFNQGFLGNLQTFSTSNQIVLKKDDYYTRLRESGERILGISNNISEIEAMRDFADKLFDLFKLALIDANKKIDKNIGATKLIIEIIHIIQGRQHFMELLKYVCDNYNNQVIQLIEMMEQTIQIWKKIKLLLYKTFKKKDINLYIKTLSGYIREASNLEEKIAQRLFIIVK